MIENYRVDELGVIHQVSFTPMRYDREYLSYYKDFNDRTIKLGYQGTGSLGRIPGSVLEIDYGTGSFIESASITGVIVCAGCDVIHYPLPDAIKYLEWNDALATEWELVAMYDVLEDISELSFVSHLKTISSEKKHLALAVPYCRWNELGDEWFHSWRMRLPNGHLHQFDCDSLVNTLCTLCTLCHYGFVRVETNTFEDGIRLREGESRPNVLSATFRRQCSD